MTDDEIPRIDYVIKNYERSVFDATPDLLDCTFKAVRAVRKFVEKGTLVERKIALNEVDHWYTRLAAAITLVIKNPTTKMTHNSLFEAAELKPAIINIFNASGYRGTRHLVAAVNIADGNKIEIPKDRLAVLFSFASLDDLSDEMMTLALAQTPRVLLTLMHGWLNQRWILTTQGERNRNRLLANAHLIESVQVTDRDIGLLVNPWMYCSYSSGHRKHDLKKSYNVVLKNLLVRAGARGGVLTPHSQKTRPKLLVIHERFSTGHAMFRCYAPSIKELGTYFELIALADDAEIGTDGRALFDEVHALSMPRPNVKQIVELISEIAPDVIYYPSLGMSHWVVMLAQLRLARVQIMSLGHPATSRSPEIDYVYSTALRGDTTPVFSEKVLQGRYHGHYELHPQLPRCLPERAQPNQSVAKIAIPAKLMKLSATLLDACRKIQEQSDREVEFVFFPGEKGIGLDALVAFLSTRLPQSVVKTNMEYPDMLRHIAKCEFALAPFPFGNTNGTVDASLLHVPTVTLIGPEPASQTDARVLDMAGFSKDLVAETLEEYIAIAVRLLNDSDFATAILPQHTRDETLARFLKNKTTEERNPIAEVFLQVYRRHEELKSVDERSFKYQELLQ